MSEVPQENGARLVLERSKKSLTREERVAFGFIAACGVGAVIFGGLSFASNIKKPLLISYTGPRYVTSQEKESEEVARQRITDSDNDGISDYDELNIFGTSPYIFDSDSDGRSDGTEVAEGGDPNCALGKTCESSELLQSGLSSEFLNAGAPEAPEQDVGSVPTLEETVGALQQLSISEVRRLLEESGVETDTLNALSDDQLMELYLEALRQASSDIQAETGTGTSQNSAEDTPSSADTP